MITTPHLSADWMKPGTKVRCRVELDVDGLPPIEVGTEAEILEQWGDGPSGNIRVGWFGDHFVDMMRGDFVYFWEPISEPLPARPRPKRSMVVDRDPSRPGKTTDQKYIGYWAASPDPDADEYQAKGILLPWPADHVDESWNEAKRSIVVQYLKDAPDVESWRGSSWCRFEGTQGRGRQRPPCVGEQGMGYTDKGDGVYVWPAGFAHYVEAHGVRPPDEFVDHVLEKLGFHFDSES
jgi:hypothetical protein